MREKLRFASVMLLGTLGCCLSSARASVTTYNYFYVAGQATYSGVTPGSTVNVPIYLQEVNSDASTNSLLVSEDGLFGAGVSVAYNSGDATTTITGVSTNSGSPTTGFDNILDQSFASSSAAILEQVNTFPPDSDGVAAGPQINGISSVFLGTLTLAATPTPGQTTTFTVGRYDPVSGNSVTYTNGYDLDDNADPLGPPDAATLYNDAAPTNFSIITSVPEPASISLIALSAALLASRRRQNKSRRI